MPKSKLQKWIDYHFNIPQSPAPKGDVRNADFVCPQAFGRNTWTDKEIPSVMEYLRYEIKSEDMPLFQDDFFCLLEQNDFNPGAVNAALARGCYRIAKRMATAGKDPWIIGQWEVIYALAKCDNELTAWYENNRRFIISIWPPKSGEYLGTRGMLLAAREISQIFKLSKATMIAHREHLARCALLADKIFGKENVTVPSEGFPADDEMQFDPLSKQDQTTGPKAWRAYEFKARLHHTLRGWTAF